LFFVCHLSMSKMICVPASIGMRMRSIGTHGRRLLDMQDRSGGGSLLQSRWRSSLPQLDPVDR
jgi:hypothetical protein